jgi:hypothetical protein
MKRVYKDSLIEDRPLPLLESAGTAGVGTSSGRVDPHAGGAKLTSLVAFPTIGPSLDKRARPMLRETRYALSGEASLAFQTFGDGPVEIVLGLGWLSNLDAIWEEPRFRRYLAALGSFARVIAFDARGTGLSDAIRLSV